MFAASRLGGLAGGGETGPSIGAGIVSAAGVGAVSAIGDAIGFANGVLAAAGLGAALLVGASTVAAVAAAGGVGAASIESPQAIPAKAGTITTPGSTGDQSYTGLGFQPIALLLFTNGRAAGAAGLATSDRMLGFTTGASNNFCHAARSNHGVGSSACVTGFSEANCIFLSNITVGTTRQAAALVSFDADGFTLNWSVSAAAGTEIQYLAIPDTGGVSAFAGNFDKSNNTSNQSVTGVGFTPKLVLTTSSLRGTTAETWSVSAHGNFTIGAMDAAGHQWAVATFIEDNVSTTNSDQVIVTNRAWASEQAKSVLDDFSFVSMDGDGFTVDHGVSAAAITVGFLALAGADLSAFVGTDTQKTSSGTQAKTGVGFQPNVLLFAGGDGVTGGTFVDSATISIGVAADGAPDQNIVCASSDKDNLADTAIAQYTATDKSIAFLAATGGPPPTTATINAESSVNSFDSDGYTNNWSTADATARLFGVVAMRIAA